MRSNSKHVNVCEDSALCVVWHMQLVCILLGRNIIVRCHLIAMGESDSLISPIWSMTAPITRGVSIVICLEELVGYFKVFSSCIFPLSQSIVKNMQRRSILLIQHQKKRVVMRTLVMKEAIQVTMTLLDMQTRRQSVAGGT